MGTKERLEILRDKIKCPQFGDIEYGEWGALRLEQRKAIKDLIDSNKNKDNTINDLLKRISDLEFEVEKLNNIINELEEWLKEEVEATVFDYHFAIEDVLDKLQELKGEDKE